MTLRALAVTVLVVAPLAWLAATWTSRQAAEAERLASGRLEDGTWLEPGTTAAQAAAFGGTLTEGGIPPIAAHPPPGAVLPESFPPPRFQWKDEYASRTYEVVLSGPGDRVVFRGITTERELRPPAATWDTVRASPGVYSWRVRGALVDPAGRVIGEASSSESAQLTVAPKAENPTGLILFGQKLRPPERPTGTVPLLMMHLEVQALDLERMEHRGFFRSSTGHARTVRHPERARRDQADPTEPTTTQCVSCHAASTDGRYLAMFSQEAEESPPGFDAPNGFLTLLAMPERRVLKQLPHAFMPAFNPVDHHLVAFGTVDETIGAKDQQMVRKSDLQVLDIKTGEVRDVPGANLPDRVENFPMWSPDGKLLTFIRTKEGEIWHGAQGHIDVAAIPYNGGAGGTAVDVLGAAQNGKSNYLPIYSPDGRWIVFTQANQGFFSQESADLMIVSSAGGEARRLACSSANADSWHRFSPDGRWLAVVSNREDIRRPHIYLGRFDTQKGECSPAVQMPVVAGPGAHTHAFSWTPRFDWITDYPLVARLRE